ncbi:membrane or secreted protein [Nonlabens antarcticus]|uniref:membrane or secreted protein n=1 Tax=Nonlabens antarcticus TaxID=392714 RepID=UPI0018915F72|nr:membrane or secreted protein [Nonlabens antarcticus]
MKYILMLTMTVICWTVKAQDLNGAWENTVETPTGQIIKTVLVFANGYGTQTIYDAYSGRFMSTLGGSFVVKNGVLSGKIEFDSRQPQNVGTTISLKISLEEDKLYVLDSNMLFDRIDHGTSGKLSGAWLMSGRVKDGKEQIRDANIPRKTMKILSGTRFQWIAYNTETKEFMGTGGGSYTTVDGVYTENIEFFSKDDSRVGASLDFNFELSNGDWIHKGMSSKGDPLHEIWKLRL